MYKINVYNLRKFVNPKALISSVRAIGILYWELFSVAMIESNICGFLFLLLSPFFLFLLFSKLYVKPFTFNQGRAKGIRFDFPPEHQKQSKTIENSEI